MNMAWPARARATTSWSMTPVGTPTNTVSALWATAASRAGSKGAPARSERAPAAATSRAALEDRPAPVGRSLVTETSAPSTSTPSPASAHATPAT